MRKKRFITKLAAKLLLGFFAVILLYLFESRILEINGVFATSLEKILLICCLAYGIHVIVEQIAAKKFPSDASDREKNTDNLTKKSFPQIRKRIRLCSVLSLLP